VAGLKSSQVRRKKKNEHRTSNIERPTSNNVFFHFKKKASLLRQIGYEGRERIYPSKICGSLVLK
jgi:hypothetical protein